MRTRPRARAKVRASPGEEGGGAFRALLIPSSEAERHAGFHVLALDPWSRLRRDERDAGVGVACRFLPALQIRDAGVHAQRRHPERILLGRCGDRARGDVSYALTATVDRDEDDSLLLPSSLECLERAARGRLVDRVHEIDVRILLQTVLHSSLPFGLIAVTVGHADHLWWTSELVARLARCWKAESLKKTVVPLRADGMAGEQVKRRNLRRLSCECRPC